MAGRRLLWAGVGHRIRLHAAPARRPMGRAAAARSTTGLGGRVTRVQAKNRDPAGGTWAGGTTRAEEG